MPIDDQTFARTIVQLLRTILDLQTTVAAMGLALKDREDAHFERDVGVHREALLARAAPLLARFDQAEAADLLDLLMRLNLPRQ